MGLAAAEGVSGVGVDMLAAMLQRRRCVTTHVHPAAGLQHLRVCQWVVWPEAACHLYDLSRVTS
jgi:hypothetical protein